MVNALILAGDRGEDGKPKALLMIAGRLMIEYVIESLRASECIDRIYVVGEKILEGSIGHLVDGFCRPSGGIIDNVKNSIKLMDDSKTSCIICTCDIPMVKGQAIRDFVEKCQAQSIDLGYPIIDKRLNDEKYPDVKRTYVKLREGTYTGGNIFYVNPLIIDRCTSKAGQLVEYRKNPLKMGRVLGFTFLLRLAAGCLSITAVEKKVSRMFKISCTAIITDYPEIGNDVDKPSDIEFVNKYMNKTA
jgi:GTP:adenosylcobinamide-phosphate guanylyltransferase